MTTESTDNKNVTWLVQSNFIDNERTAALCFAIQNSEAALVGVSVKPFTEDIAESGVDVSIGKNVVPYGSTKLAKLSMTAGYSGMFYNDNFNVTKWVENRDDMLNSDMVTMKASDVIEFLKDKPDDLPMFIRPAQDLKAFPGGVVDVSEIRSWMKDYQSGNFIFQEDTEICLAPVKEILSETRWFVVGGKVIDGSVYRLRGQRTVFSDNDANSLKLAQQLADKWLPHEVCVMDVAEVDGALKVIEFNCFNCSGFYAHDARKITAAVNDYMLSKIEQQ